MNEKNKRSLSQDAYKILLNRLLSNQLVPGEILNRRAVAEELGISVAPVLEAMLQLEAEGFLESMPRKGTRVRPIKEDDVRGHLIVREALECQAVRMYCGDAVKQCEANLIPLAEEIDSYTEATPERSRRDIDLHKKLVGLTKCSILIEEYNRIMKVGVFHIMNRFLPISDKKVMLSHVELIKHLRKDDPDAMEKLMREHLRSGKHHFLDDYYKY